MSLFDTFAIIAVAALTQASFQLSVSSLTLMSGHALGKKTAHMRLLHLCFSLIAGVFFMTALLLAFTSITLTSLLPTITPLYVWALACGLAMGVGVSVWLFYFRKQKGTVLWIPRSFASYIADRAQKTKNPAEAFGLGLSSVVGEIIFIVAPILISGLLIVRLDTSLQLMAIALYAFIAVLPTLIVTFIIGGGRSISKVQKWREQHKKFLQFVAGSVLILLGIYLYIDTVSIALALGGIQ